MSVIMDGGFDGLNDLKHERVAKALAQVNGFPYRYQPTPKNEKKILRFDSDDDDESSDDDKKSSDEVWSDEEKRQKHLKPNTEEVEGPSSAHVLTFDDHIDNLLRKTHTLAMLKIANNTAGIISSDSEDDSEEADDLVTKELNLGCLTELGSRTNGALSGKLSNAGSSIANGRSTLVGTAAMKLARTLSAFLCLPRAISYVDLEAITEKLLESNDHFDDDEYADLIDYHVESARCDESNSETEEDKPIWKRRKSQPIQPLKLSQDRTDLELHQRQIFMEANRFGGVSSRNLFLASSNHLLSRGDSKGSVYPSFRICGRSLEASKLGSSINLSSEMGLLSNASGDEVAASQFDEGEYMNWRTQVKDDYLAWINAKVEAQKRRKSRIKKVDPNKKPRWLVLYEASKPKIPAGRNSVVGSSR